MENEFGEDTGRVATAISEVVEGLNDLLQLDHDAIGAYEIAIEHLHDRDAAAQIDGFKQDHERHIRDLTQCIAELGGVPIQEPHATAPLKEALQRVGASAGDHALLLAWRTNEFQVMTRYDRYAHRAVFWPAEAKRVVDANALDEERHYQWVVERLGGEGEPAEVDLANRVRERRWRSTTPAGLQEGHRWGRVRDRAAGTLAGAADRLEELAQRGSTEEGPGARLAEGARRFAHELDSTAQRVREGSGVRDEVEHQLRGRPARTLAIAFAIGFVIGRILR